MKNLIFTGTANASFTHRAPHSAQPDIMEMFPTRYINPSITIKAFSGPATIREWCDTVIVQKNCLPPLFFKKVGYV